MTVDWQTGDTVTSTCTRCQAQHGDTPHAVLEEHGDGEYSVRCSSCGHAHRDRVVGPQAGPQTEFMESTAYIVLYGGARGGGKSWALEMIALLYCHIPGWTGLILRRELGDITKAGGLWDKAKRCYAGTGAVFVQSPHHHVVWPSGAKLDFGYLGDRNIRSYQGQEFAYIGVDEATHFDLDDLMWLATCNRSTCGAPTIMRWTCNPDPDHALREWVDPWLLPNGRGDRSKSGALLYFAMGSRGDRVWGSVPVRLAEQTGRDVGEVYSFTLITAQVYDNLILMEADPTYVGKLSLRGPVVEAQHKDGDWNARANVKGLLRKLLERTVTEPFAQLDGTGARGTDMAATEPHDGNKNPDFTASPLVLRDVEHNYYFAGLAICRREPPGVLEMMRSTATLDGPRITQGVYRDPAQAGKGYALFVEEQLRKSPRCGPVVIEPCGNQQDQKVKNAAPVAEALRQGKMFLLVAPWIDEPYEDGGEAPKTIMGLIRSQLSTFPSDKKTDKDDIIDGLGLAYKLAKNAHVVVGSPRETALEGQRLAAQRGGLRGGGRRGYGGRR